jgi:spore coat polysaccharide biosynthesis predicted glycosyltransferase SpsG
MGVFVVNFEDLGEGADEAHLVFNALYEKTNPKQTHRFGYEYECLNERFYLYDTIKFNEVARVLFVSFGGVDQNNITCRVLKLVPEIFSNTSLKKIIVVIGPSYAHKEDLHNIMENLKHCKDRIEIHENVKNMPKLMSKSDIAITSNGRTVYELTAMGIPTISISQNDRETLHLFTRYHKGIKYLGIACNVKDWEILNTIKEIANNQDVRKKMYEEQIKASKIIRKGINKIVNEIVSEYWGWRDDNS